MREKTHDYLQRTEEQNSALHTTIYCLPWMDFHISVNALYITDSVLQARHSLANCTEKHPPSSLYLSGNRLSSTSSIQQV